MKLKGLIIVVFLLSLLSTHAVTLTQNSGIDSIPKYKITDVDSLLECVSKNAISKHNFLDTTKQVMSNQAVQQNVIQPFNSEKDTLIQKALSNAIPYVKIDSLLLSANPFFIELIYKGLPYDIKVYSKPDLRTLFYGQKAKTITTGIFKDYNNPSTNQIINDLRKRTTDKITQRNADLYIWTFDELPSPDQNKDRFITRKQFADYLSVIDDPRNSKRRKLILKPGKLYPWQYKVSTIAQFSENYISPNWYQGGNSNLAILGIVTGQLTYNDRKSIQWDNNAEWRMGFNSVAGDSIHPLSTNDDILKISSKLGIKAKGNFFYSASVDFSTQFFNSYNGVNSNLLKASLFTPIRLNVGLGMDYKYKEIFSLLFSPLTYKYIYADDKRVDPNLFGIKTGENTLSQLGSSLKTTLSYALTPEIHFDSNLMVYTNYKQVTVDWEIVANLTINRFLSTRISFNPRYDNTVIEKNGNIAKLQLKQFLSVGFSHRFN
jgi:hypothetical protein